MCDRIEVTLIQRVITLDGPPQDRYRPVLVVAVPPVGTTVLSPFGDGIDHEICEVLLDPATGHYSCRLRTANLSLFREEHEP